MPKFSIIVPIYNVEQYLERCIESLIHQTLTEIEIILVDDGSPDGCPQICDHYADQDSRIRVIHKENGGVSAARNDGLGAATGEWVIFCDSDDWMEPDACEALYRAGTDQNADIVVGDINRIKNGAAIYNRFFADEFVYETRAELDELIQADIYQNYTPNPPSTPTIGYGGPWNKAVKRMFLLNHKILFDTSLMGIFDDIFYTANIYQKAEKVVYIHKAVYNYVVVAASITRSYKPDSLEINRRIFKAFGKFIKTYAPGGEWDKAYAAMIIRRLEEVLRLYFFSKKNTMPFNEMIKELKATMQSEPYQWAIKSVEINKLQPNHKKLARLARWNCIYALWGLYQLKIILRKI